MESVRVTKIIGSILALLITVIAKAAAAPIPTTFPTIVAPYDTQIAGAEWNFQALFPLVFQAYTAPFGPSGQILVYASIFFTAMVCLVIRQEDVLLASILVMVFGNVLYWNQFVPQQWAFYIIVIFFLLPVTGIAYSIYKSKR